MTNFLALCLSKNNRSFAIGLVLRVHSLFFLHDCKTLDKKPLFPLLETSVFPLIIKIMPGEERCLSDFFSQKQFRGVLLEKLS